MVKIKTKDGTFFIEAKDAVNMHFENVIEVIDDSNELKQEIQKQLLHLQKQRITNIYSQYGYINLADIQYYASQNDEEAKTILNWYQTYDDAIWNYIDNDLQAITDINQLLQIDLKTIEQQIFENSIKTSPLP